MGFGSPSRTSSSSSDVGVLATGQRVEDVGMDRVVTRAAGDLVGLPVAAEHRVVAVLMQTEKEARLGPPWVTQSDRVASPTDSDPRR